MPPSILPPPSSIFLTVEQWAPGAYQFFWGNLLDAVRTPVIPTSYFRDPGTNRRVGGSPDSQHQIGTALDLVFQSEAGKMEALAALNGQLIWVDEGTHVHVQLWPAGAVRNAGLLDALGL